MKGKRADHLINNCADLAAHAKDVKSYVILYQQKDGSINYHRDGSACEQLGMLEVTKRGIINGFFEPTGEDDDAR